MQVMLHLKITWFGSIFFLVYCSACIPNKKQLDKSHQLGVISAFSEMVAADVKQLALSSPLTPAQAEALSS